MFNLQNPVIAHRGASAYAPENTLAAFNEGLRLGCSSVEFDVMLSLDGVPFVFHDEKLKRTTRVKGRFGSKSADEIKQLDAGRWFSRKFKGESIPTFQEVLTWLAKHEVQANIEIKPTKGTTEQTTITVLSYLNQYWPAEKTLPLISSFEEDVLKLCRKLSPEVPMGLLLDKWNKNWENMAGELACYSVHLNASIANKAHVEEIKLKGYKVFVYTVNRKRKARALLKKGVDAIFSDYPDLLL